MLQSPGPGAQQWEVTQSLGMPSPGSGGYASTQRPKLQ